MNITHKEIAIIFNISTKNASQKLSRIKKKLNIEAYKPLSINQLSEFLNWNVETLSNKLGWKIDKN